MLLLAAGPVNNSNAWSISLSGTAIEPEDSQKEFVRADYVLTDMPLRSAIDAAITRFLEDEFWMDNEGDIAGSIETITITRATAVLK